MPARFPTVVAITLFGLLCCRPALAQQPAAAADTARDDGWRAGWEDHPQVEWRGLRLEFRGQLHAELVDSDGPIRRVEANTMDIARRRIAIDGAVGRRLRFQAEAELDEDSPLRDLYVNYRAGRAAQLRGGRFKIPLGLEENTPYARLEFARRTAMSNRLAAGRAYGAMLYGAAGRIDYAAGVFADDGDNAQPGRAVRVAGGPTIAAHLVLDPFRGARSSLADLEMGAAFTHSTLPEGYPAIRGRTVLGVAFFDSDFWVSGTRRRAGLELRWRPGPLAFMAEAIALSDGRKQQSLDRTDLPNAMARGWYVSGSWVVAGATRASNVDEPRTPLFGGGWGSLQLAVRREALAFGDVDLQDPPIVLHRATAIPGSDYHATTAGVSWYATRWTRLQANVIREELGGTLINPAAPTRIWDRVFRFQLVL